ncbi:hypothetical protein HYH02_010755 [Chlamydomonas schloesseri]|uniref:Metallo-beta-lactamase domain-containing protein n=1 Tax=Chlamydomonas schloesseri TaxID=2026947 RepID=A0A835T9K0_9CHLO|nr:hypothetical protein HYH02_010755 [Chlamydomonas schloesseri]|eukprot:KAG2438963.1 hypothetical protein HYH02_010755 [Chlamydomonas schloesseri]
MQSQQGSQAGAAAPAAATPATDDMYAAYAEADSDAALEAARAVWAQVEEVDSVVVTAIVDNETDGMSTPCACCDPALDPDTRTPYASEFTAGIQRVMAGQWDCMDFTRTLMAGHGLSLLITATTTTCAPAASTTATSGDAVTPPPLPLPLRRSTLFDGGPRPDLWALNAERLGVDLAEVGAAVLSHWHVDHSGGFAAVAQAASASRARASQQAAAAAAGGGAGTTGAAAAAAAAVAQPPEPLVFDVHPDRPARRGLIMPNGKAVPFNEDVSWEQLGGPPGCAVLRQAQPHTLLDGLFFVSGAVPRRSAFELGQPGHGTQGADGVWRPDPLIMDERYLAVKVRGQGAVVFTGCSHAGVVNVVEHMTRVAGGRVFAVVGGLHLASRHMEARIPETIAALKELDPHLILAGHCTGWRAKAALLGAFPGRMQPLSVGGVYSFLAPPRASKEQPPQQAVDKEGKDE